MWLHLTHEAGSEDEFSLVCSVFCRARWAVHTEQMMCSTKILPIGSTVQGSWWAAAIHDVQDVALQRLWARLLTDSTTTRVTPSQTNYFFLLVQMFSPQLCLDLGFIKGKEKTVNVNTCMWEYICIYRSSCYSCPNIKFDKNIYCQKPLFKHT